MAFRPSQTRRSQALSSASAAPRSVNSPSSSSSASSHHSTSPYASAMTSTALGYHPSFGPDMTLSSHRQYHRQYPLHQNPWQVSGTTQPQQQRQQEFVPSIRRNFPAYNPHFGPQHTVTPSGMVGMHTSFAHYAPSQNAPRGSNPQQWDPMAPGPSSQPPPASIEAPVTSYHAPLAHAGSSTQMIPTGSSSTGSDRRPNKRSRSSYDNEEQEHESGEAPGSEGEGLIAKKACSRCNRDKVKCRYRPGSTTCLKCEQRKLPCQERETKLTPAAGRKQYIEAQLREKDAIIESLLKELYNPYRAHPLSMRTMQDATSPAEHQHPETEEWRSRLGREADKADIGIFSFHPPTEASEVSSAPTVEDQTPKDEGPLDDAAPIAMLTNLSLEDGADADAEEQRSNSSGSSTAADETPGPANLAYFKPGAGMDLQLRAKMGLKYATSPLINHKLMTENDVNELFDLYHQKVNSIVPLLDPVLHTPQTTYARCPTLFSVVCAVASRYHKKKAHMYPIVMHIARNEASTALMNGWKSIELAQAFILLALYAPPAKRWEDERGYLYTGIATRLAIDLNAHRCALVEPKDEADEREQLNKRRLWMICFETDWAMAAHYGKPAAVKENQIIRVSDTFYHHSHFGLNLVGDIGLSAYNKLLRLVAKFHTEVYSNPDSRTGLRRDLDFPTLVETYTTELDALFKEWMDKFESYDKFRDDPVYKLRCDLFPYVVHYKRLLMQSFAFQQALERGIRREDRGILKKCMDSAMNGLEHLLRKLVPSGYMLYSPNGWINYGAFSGAFLVKLLRPEFGALISAEERQQILDLVRRLVDALHSPKLAIDERHAPKLWAHFFEQLLAKHARAPQPVPAQPSPEEFISPMQHPQRPEYYPTAGTAPGEYGTSQGSLYDPYTAQMGPGYVGFTQPQDEYYYFNFGEGASGSGSGPQYGMPDPSTRDQTNMMLPGYHWGAAQYEDEWVPHQGQWQGW